MFDPVAFFTQYQALKGVKPETWEKLSQTWPARMAQSAWNAATLPGDVWNGKVDPLSEEGIGRATDLAGLTMSSTLASPRGSIGVGPVLPKKGLMAVEPPTPMTMTPPQGIRAYHGSPYDFDKFSLSRIGTGEGHQAYGHGLYFAEHPYTAESYISNANWKLGNTNAQTIYDRLYSPQMERGLDNDGWSKLNAQRAFWEKVVLGRSPRQILTDAKVNPDQYGANELAYMLSLNPEKFKRTGPGKMYDVNINAKPDQFLDWDKPLNLQSPQVQKSLENFGYKNRSNELKEFDDALLAALQDNGPTNLPKEPMNPLGRDIYEKLPIPDRSPARTSAVLNEAGIPGIRFLDQLSRPEGKGTFNYVVFNDALIDILRKYGIAGAAAAPVIAGAANQQEPVANY